MADDELMEDLEQEETEEPKGFKLPSLPMPIVQPVEVDKEAAKDVFSIDMREDMDDITSMSDEDRAWAFGTAGIGEIDEPEELDDLFEVSEEDIIGDEPEETKPKFKYKLPSKRYIPQRPYQGMKL